MSRECFVSRGFKTYLTEIHPMTGKGGELVCAATLEVNLEIGERLDTEAISKAFDSLLADLKEVEALGLSGDVTKLLDACRGKDDAVRRQHRLSGRRTKRKGGNKR